MKELIDFSSLNEAFNLPVSEPVWVDWGDCFEISEPDKMLSRIAKERWATAEGMAHLKANGRKTMAKMQGDADFQEKRLAGLRAKCELTWNIQKGDVVDQVTLKEFIAKYGGNLGSLKQLVWRRGAYKGWVFTANR